MHMGKTRKDAAFWAQLWDCAAIAPPPLGVDVSAGVAPVTLEGHEIEAARCCAIFTAERERRKLVGLCNTYRKLGRESILAAMREASRTSPADIEADSSDWLCGPRCGRRQRRPRLRQLKPVRSRRRS